PTCLAVFGASESSCVTVSLQISPLFSMRYETRESSSLSSLSQSTRQVSTSRLGASDSITVPSTSREPFGPVECHSDPRFQSEWSVSLNKYFFVIAPSVSACHSFSGVVRMKTWYTWTSFCMAVPSSCDLSCDNAAANGAAYLLTQRSWTSRIGTGFR